MSTQKDLFRSISDSAVPISRKAFGKSKRHALRHFNKLHRRYERALAAGHSHKARNLRARLLASGSGRLVAVAAANRKLRKARREPFSELPRVAANLNAWRGSSTPAVATAKEKRNGGVRVTLSFGLEHRALQFLARKALAPTLNVDSRQHGWKNGGRDAACKRIIEAIEAGREWFLPLDIEDFYGSIEKGGLYDLIELPRQIIDNVICPPRNIVPNHNGVVVMGISPVTVAREGISQGSSVSPLVGEAVVSSVLNEIQSDVVIANYADDFGLVAHTRAELEAVSRALTCAFRRCPCGPFRLKVKCSIRHVTEGFDFLGYHIRKHANGVVCMPSQANRDEFHTKVLELVREVQARRKAGAIARLRAYIRHWRAAFRLFDDGGDLFWPRFWARGVIRQHLPEMGDAVADMLACSGRSFAPEPANFIPVNPRRRMRRAERERREVRRLMDQGFIEPMWAPRS